MTSLVQIQTNRQNAAHSTGPNTPVGKGKSSQNALRHGLRSDLPVLPGEQVEEWEAHRAGILQSLAPVGALETELAGRVALCLWRLRRVAAYETATTALGIEQVEEETRRQAEKLNDPLIELTQEHDRPAPVRLAQAEKELAQARKTLEAGEGALRLFEHLPQLPDEARVEGDDAYGVFQDLLDAADGLCEQSLPDAEDEDLLVALGVPRDELADAYAWDGWAAGMVRKGAARIALYARITPEKLLARAHQQRQEDQAECRDTIRALEAKARDLRRRIRIDEERLRQRRTIPARDTLEKITRYEAHLTRQLLQALHTLQRLQAARAGEPVPPPAVLDVTLDANPAAAAALGAGSGGSNGFVWQFLPVPRHMAPSGTVTHVMLR